MIAKRMRMQSASKSSYGMLARYVSDTQNKEHRVESISITNCINADIDWAVAEIESTQRMNTRSKIDKTYHLLISFNREDADKLTPERLKAIETFFCEQLGYSEHQRISAVHADTDNPHIHFAINKVHPDKHNVHEPFYDYTILADACNQIEQKYGLKVNNHQTKKTSSQNRSDDMERFSGIESFMTYLKNNCIETVRKSGDWESLHKALAKHNIVIKERGAGLVFKDFETGIMVKASSVARDFSKQSLEKRLGKFIDSSVYKNNQQSNSAHADGHRKQDQTTAGNTKPTGYKKRPIENDGLSEMVYRRYKLNNNINRWEKQRLINKAWETRKKREMEVKTAAIRRRRFIKGTTKGLSKKFAYKLAHDKLLKDLENVSLELNAELKQINEMYSKSLTWHDWLRRQAEIGDIEALELLRRRQDCEANNYVRGHGEKRDYGIHAEVDSVTRQGTEIFKGNASLRDNGKSIEVTQKISDDQMLEALKLAAQRYGKEIEVKGDDIFLEQVLSVTVKNNLDITFDDPVFEYARQKGISLQEARAQKMADELINKARTKASTTDAVQVYINERQAKIDKGMQIKEHRRFESMQESQDNLRFEGIRNIGGKRLGLFEKDNVIYVKELNNQEFQRLKNQQLHETVSLNQNGNSSRTRSK